MRIVIDVFLVIGLYFAVAGTIGILKMPDVFSRMQASTCVATLGMIGVAIAGILYAALPVYTLFFMVGLCLCQSEHQCLRFQHAVLIIL